MKKILLIILLLIPFNVYAKKEEVKLHKCIDGDTISINYNNEVKKVRFLAVDAPEIDENEPYSKEAKDFTCDLLSNSKKIYLEYDQNSDKEDKYERILAWVWADNKLVQKELIDNGYARIAYLYNDYKYTDELEKFENVAKEKKLNIWSENQEEQPKEVKKEKKKSKKDIILDKLSNSYEIIVIVISGILALLSLYLSRKK